MKKFKTTCAVIVNDKNEVLLIKRGREPFKGCWSLVSGIGESKNGLSPEKAILGEVEGDLGTNLIDIKYLFTCPVENDQKTDEVVVFRGRINNENEIRLKTGYSVDYKWISRDDDFELSSLAFEHGSIIKKFFDSVVVN